MSDQLSCGPLTNMPGILTLAYQVEEVPGALILDDLPIPLRIVPAA